MTQQKVGEVFVPGGQPTVTYFSRSSIRQEQEISEYLTMSGQLLSVTGPSKSGKTTALRKVLPPNSISLSGATIYSIDDFWEQLSYRVGAYSDETIGLNQTEAADNSFTGELNLGFAKGGATGSAGDSVQRSRTQGRSMPVELTTADKLIESPRPVVLDDFHYIERSVQTKIVRALRPMLFDGVPFILMSVPHRKEDVVRAEAELQGRVRQQPVPLWSEAELQQIGILGFKALRVSPPEELIEILARQASGSPHLMQEFCLQACRDIGIFEANTVLTSFPSGLDREELFLGCAARAASRFAINKLIRGPQSRSERKARAAYGDPGNTMDMYEAVVMTLCKFGPKEEITYDELRLKMREVLVDVPQKHEITRVLRKMDEISREAEGEPVMEWDHEESTLHVVDPFFSFLIRWLGGHMEIGSSAE